MSISKNYELSCLVSAKIDATDKETVIENINKLIKEKGGKITKTNPVSEISLGYPIKKEEKAHLAVLNFQYENQDLSGLRKEIESEPKIIRCFLRQTPVKKIIPFSKRKSRDKEKIELKDIDKKIEEIFNSKKNES